MLICRVKGEVVSTVKNDRLQNYKLLLVQPQDLKAEDLGADLIALDLVDAGIGDLVLVNKEGSSARTLLDDEKVPVQAVIVGVIDGVEIFDSDKK